MMNRCLCSLLILAGVQCLSHLGAESFRILEVNSYHSDWVWIREQHEGFVQGLGDTPAEFRSIDLDAKNRNEAGIREMVDRAIDTIEEWKPDLLFVTDDLAQREVSARYINRSIPIVFSGVNAEPADYGFDTAGNITGVLEREHFTATIAFLKQVTGRNRLKLAVIIDDDPSWGGVVDRIRQALKTDSTIEVVSWLEPRTYAGFQQEITLLQDKVDAVGMIGIFRFVDEHGRFVDYETVLRWTAEHSRLPDFSFWDTRVERGTLCAVTVSGVEQGRIAGDMARKILVERIPPARIPPEQSTRGIPMISLGRARLLGISIRAGLLLNARVLSRFVWEK